MHLSLKKTIKDIWACPDPSCFGPKSSEKNRECGERRPIPPQACTTVTPPGDEARGIFQWRRWAVALSKDAAYALLHAYVSSFSAHLHQCTDGKGRCFSTEQLTSCTRLWTWRRVGKAVFCSISLHWVRMVPTMGPVGFWGAHCCCQGTYYHPAIGSKNTFHPGSHIGSELPSLKIIKNIRFAGTKL